MIDPRSEHERIRDLVERLADRERERDKAEAEARYWREAWFTHVQEEHPEIVERLMRKVAEETS